MCLKDLGLPPDTTSDDPRLQRLAPSFDERVRKGTKEIMIDDELRRRRFEKAAQWNCTDSCLLGPYVYNMLRKERRCENGKKLLKNVSAKQKRRTTGKRIEIVVSMVRIISLNRHICSIRSLRLAFFSKRRQKQEEEKQLKYPDIGLDKFFGISLQRRPCSTRNLPLKTSQDHNRIDQPILGMSDHLQFC